MEEKQKGSQFVAERSKHWIGVESPAKINLTLDIVGLLPNGYHTIESIMHPVSLVDVVTVGVLAGEENTRKVELHASRSGVPTDHTNLCAVAVEHFFKYTGVGRKPLVIYIDKSIPMMAGLAGGSANAAATLKALNFLFETKLSIKQMEEIGESFGADVPFCVRETSALVTGFGERLEEVSSMPKCWIVIVKPSTTSSTENAFAAIDKVELAHRPHTKRMVEALHTKNLPLIGKLLCNVFETVVNPKYTAELKLAFMRLGAVGASLTGSGTAVYALFSEKEKAESAKSYFEGLGIESFLCEPLF